MQMLPAGHSVSQYARHSLVPQLCKGETKDLFSSVLKKKTVWVSAHFCSGFFNPKKWTHDMTSWNKTLIGLVVDQSIHLWVFSLFLQVIGI